MIITINTTLNIAAENEALVPVIAAQKGYVEGDINAFIQNFLAQRETQSINDVLIPAIVNYFGLQGKATADAVIAQLSQGALTVNVTIQ